MANTLYPNGISLSLNPCPHKVTYQSFIQCENRGENYWISSVLLVAKRKCTLYLRHCTMHVNRDLTMILVLFCLYNVSDSHFLKIDCLVLHDTYTNKTMKENLTEKAVKTCANFNESEYKFWNIKKTLWLQKVDLPTYGERNETAVSWANYMEPSSRFGMFCIENAQIQITDILVLKTISY